MQGQQDLDAKRVTVQTSLRRISYSSGLFSCQASDRELRRKWTDWKKTHCYLCKPSHKPIPHIAKGRPHA